MLILTQNCSWLPVRERKHRMQEIARTIEEMQPDVVFLQEVILMTYVQYFHLTGYEMFYEKGRLWIQGGLVILVKKSLGKAEFKRYHRYGKQGKILSRQVAVKVIKCGFLEVYLPERDLTLINTYLIPLFRPYFVEDKNQRWQLRELLEESADKQRVLVGGDFNLTQGSSFHDLLLNQFEDLSHGVGRTYKAYQGRFTGFLSKEIRFPRRKYPMDWEKQIDFIFAKNLTFAVQDKGTIQYNSIQVGRKKVEITDHLGVWVDVKEIK
jgi:endonuclease/exonuclease/phosphatase family metal-dependent hydrolase